MAEHGTHAKYSKGCRCKLCTEGHREYERNAARRRRRIKYGIESEKPRLVDSTETREHVVFLQSKGIGLGQIAQQVGTHRATIQYIRRGKRPHITKNLSDKILAIPAIPRTPMAYTSTRPLLEMLEKLEERGVSRKDVGRRLGYRYGNLGLKNSVRVWRYKEIETLCTELLRTRP
jgi:hypothetical protein